MDYVLPLKTSGESDVAELAGYLDTLCDCPVLADVIVVDGSPPDVFERNGRIFPSRVRHLVPDSKLPCRNGKVAGVLTGFAAATSDTVVVADDDVRYEPHQLGRLAEALLTSDVVCPQNYFDPLPWHAKWDSARIVLNRAFVGDYPGTLGVRLTPVLREHGYDGDVLFENLELIRTIRVSGGRRRMLHDLYVRRLPPSSAHFRGQRLRQAYDSTAQPLRMLAELSVLPLAAASLRWRTMRRLAMGAAACLVGLAEWGRRRAGGGEYFPPSTLLFVPLWLLERGGCAWAALTLRITGRGISYAGFRLIRAATPMRELRKTMRACQ